MFLEANQKLNEYMFEEILNENDGIRRGPFGGALKKDIFVKESDYVVYEQRNAIYDRFDFRYKISFKKYEEMKSFLVKEGDFLLSGAGTIGKISRVPRNASKGIINQALIRIRIDSEKVNPDYFLHWMRSEKMQHRLTSGNPGSAITNLVPLSEVKKWLISIPSIDEQRKIGVFFNLFDNLIALHQQELNALKQAKKGFLQKMFPSEGQSVPEIRFKEFKDVWSDYKLNEISEKVKEKNVDNVYSETLTNSAEFGIINQRDFFDKDISNKLNLYTYYVVHPDDFVYNPRISKLAPVGPIKRNKLGRVGVMSPLYYVFRIRNLDLTYLEYYFSTEKWHMFMKLNGDSGARSDRISIKDSIFNEMPIPLPSIEEQFKIGKFFKQLDEVINLKEKELEALKQTKQGFLQKMFV